MRLRVAVVAGPDPGHAFPAVALCLRLAAAGHAPLLLSGRRWLDPVQAAGVTAVELPGVVAPDPGADTDAGFRLHGRAARMAPALAELFGADRPDLVVADTLTVAGGLAAELVGVPWLELVPHPLQRASVALPPSRCRRRAAGWHPGVPRSAGPGTRCCAGCTPGRLPPAGGSGPPRGSRSRPAGGCPGGPRRPAGVPGPGSAM